jgi:hypothetical protein
MIEGANLNGFGMKYLRTSKVCGNKKGQLKFLKIDSA